MIRILLAAFLAFAPVLACADDAAPPPPERSLPAPASPAPSLPTPVDVRVEQKSVQGWGGANPDCAEWSDACVTCTKDGCSTPGIACTPKKTACRRK